MNLATEPWIPVIRMDGEPALASLSQIFEEGDEYLDLAVRPHERIALMRLLVCVAQAALDGPEDVDEWDEVPNRLTEAAVGYLDRWRDAFDLFHPRKPFLQIPDLEAGGPLTPMSKLDFSMATGNASTLFDHGANPRDARSFSPERMALSLITYLNFSPGGLISRVKWNGQETSKSSGDAPCASSSMYHSFIHGSRLRDTIYWNLLSKSRVREFYGENRWGRPLWEAMPESLSHQSAIENATESYLGRLVPLPRLVLLNKKGRDMLLGNGLRYPAYPTVQREPSATAVQRKDKRALLGVGEKHVWRELPSLAAKRHEKDLGRALVLENIPEGKGFDLYVGALHRKSGQAEIMDTLESILHVPAGMQADASMKAYEEEVFYAEKLADRLGRAVETYRKEVDACWERRLEKAGPEKANLRRKLHGKATRHYWTAVEKLRSLLMAYVESLGGDASRIADLLSAWRKAIHGAARDAYGVACGRETPRQMRSFALGWKLLVAVPLNDKAKEKSETGNREEQK